MQGSRVAIEGEWVAPHEHSPSCTPGITHIALNMLALWFVGGSSRAEARRRRYLTVYLLSALGGSGCFVRRRLAVPGLRSGRPGAVFGLFGALFVLMLRLRFTSGP